MSAHPLLDHRGPWTEEEFLALPELDGFRVELDDGELHLSPLGDNVHQRIVTGLILAFRPLLRAGFWVLPGANVHVKVGQISIPDLVVVRKSAELLNEPSDVHLAAEVVSRWGKARDRILKPALYGEAGIPLYLRVEQDPQLELILSRCERGAYVEVARAVEGEWLEIAVLGLSIEVSALLRDD